MTLSKSNGTGSESLLGAGVLVGESEGSWKMRCLTTNFRLNRVQRQQWTHRLVRKGAIGVISETLLAAGSFTIVLLFAGSLSNTCVM